MILCRLSLTLLNMWVRRVSLSWISEYAEFPCSHWSREVSYSPESLRSPSFFHDSWLAEFTIPNVWVRWVLLSWISEFAKFLSWLLACWVSLSLMSEYAEFHSPEFLSLQRLSHDSCWVSLSLMSEYAEFHSPESHSALGLFSKNPCAHVRGERNCAHSAFKQINDIVGVKV